MARGKRSGFSFNGSLTAVLWEDKYGVRYKNVFQRFMRNKQLQPYFHAINSNGSQVFYSYLSFNIFSHDKRPSLGLCFVWTFCLSPPLSRSKKKFQNCRIAFQLYSMNVLKSCIGVWYPPPKRKKDRLSWFKDQCGECGLWWRSRGGKGWMCPSSSNQVMFNDRSIKENWIDSNPLWTAWRPLSSDTQASSKGFNSWGWV